MLYCRISCENSNKSILCSKIDELNTSLKLSSSSIRSFESSLSEFIKAKTTYEKELKIFENDVQSNKDKLRRLSAEFSLLRRHIDGIKMSTQNISDSIFTEVEFCILYLH